MALQLPVYGASIVSLMNSLLRHYGVPPFHSTLDILDRRLEKGFRNVALLVFDGLGANILQKHLKPDGFFAKHRAGTIMSIYPCTTTAAITTFASGLSPLEHGWIGWSCYFKEVDACVDLFSGNLSGIAEGAPATQEHIAYRYLGFETVLSRIQEAAPQVKAVGVSPFAEYYADTCEGICRQVEALCRQPGRKFISAYHFQPDKLMHELGIGDKRIGDMVRRYEERVLRMARELEDTLLIVTADHGMTDMTMKFVEDFPEIAECLRHLISLEPRCCGLFVKEEYREAFPRRFGEAFGDHFLLLTREEFLGRGFLGEGEAHPKVRDFVGDYMALATSDIGLWRRNNHGKGHDFKAGHAGLRREEMEVPLILAECGEA